MASKIKVGGTVQLTSTAEYPDPANQGAFLPDPNATIVWQESVAGVAGGGSVVTLVDNGTTQGVGTVTATGVAPGTATIQDYAVDADGHATPLGNPYDVTVEADQPSTDATQVSDITEVPAAAPAA